MHLISIVTDHRVYFLLLILILKIMCRLNGVRVEDLHKVIRSIKTFIIVKLLKEEFSLTTLTMELKSITIASKSHTKFSLKTVNNEIINDRIRSFNNYIVLQDFCVCKICILGSWGREWWIGGKRTVHCDGITEEGIDALNRLNDEVVELLNTKNEYSQFGLVGSGLQRKVDRLTLGVQVIQHYCYFIKAYELIFRIHLIDSRSKHRVRTFIELY